MPIHLQLLHDKKKEGTPLLRAEEVCAAELNERVNSETICGEHKCKREAEHHLPIDVQQVYHKEKEEHLCCALN